MSDQFRHFSFITLFLLACFHVPIIWIGDDSIGLWDLYLVVYFILLFAFPVRGKSGPVPHFWREFFLLALLFGAYQFFGAVMTRKTYSILLVIKYFEAITVAYCCLEYFWRFRDDMPRLLTFFQVVIFAMNVFQLAYFFGGFGWYRIGLPFKAAVSPNPAGFILGLSVFLYLSVILPLRKNKLPSLVAFGTLAVTFLLTFSRTNLFAVLAVVAVYYGAGMVRHVKRLLVLIVVSTLLLGTLFYLNATSELVSIGRVITILSDPRAVLQDTSFSIRYQILWPRAIDAWTTNVGTLGVGTGTGNYEVIDGTIPRLLGNQGIIGLVLFFAVWFGFFVHWFGSHAIVRNMLLFVFINGITAETLVISYRTVQIYVFVLFFFVFAAEYVARRAEPLEHGLGTQAMAKAVRTA